MASVRLHIECQPLFVFYFDPFVITVIAFHFFPSTARFTIGKLSIAFVMLAPWGMGETRVPTAFLTLKCTRFVLDPSSSATLVLRVEWSSRLVFSS